MGGMVVLGALCYRSGVLGMIPTDPILVFSYMWETGGDVGRKAGGTTSRESLMCICSVSIAL